jgi:hypothetical protein
VSFQIATRSSNNLQADRLLQRDASSFPMLSTRTPPTVTSPKQVPASGGLPISCWRILNNEQRLGTIVENLGSLEKARLAGLRASAGNEIRERSAGPGRAASHARILHDLRNRRS